MAFSKTYDGDEPVRINKWLGQSGVCSRREADALIADGLVSVDGEVVADAGRKLEPGQRRRYLAGGRNCSKSKNSAFAGRQ
jgi:23S rRNA pseudouridine2604 synthase